MLRIGFSCVLVLLALALLGGTWISQVGAAELFVKNDCSEQVRLAIRYKDSSSGLWQTKAWYVLDPGKRTYLVSQGKRLRTDSSVFYYYGETAGKNFVWAGRRDSENDRSYTVDGRELRFRYVRDAKGNRDLRLTCSSAPPRSPQSPPPRLEPNPELLCLQNPNACCPEFGRPWDRHGLLKGHDCNMHPA